MAFSLAPGFWYGQVKLWKISEISRIFKYLFGMDPTQLIFIGWNSTLRKKRITCCPVINCVAGKLSH